VDSASDEVLPTKRGTTARAKAVVIDDSDDDNDFTIAAKPQAAATPARALPKSLVRRTTRWHYVCEN
jgi:hypothetical protein